VIKNDTIPDLLFGLLSSYQVSHLHALNMISKESRQVNPLCFSDSLDYFTYLLKAKVNRVNNNFTTGNALSSTYLLAYLLTMNGRVG